MTTLIDEVISTAVEMGLVSSQEIDSLRDDANALDGTDFSCQN